MQPEQAPGSGQPSSRADWGQSGSAFSAAAPEAGAPSQVLPFPAHSVSHALEACSETNLTSTVVLGPCLKDRALSLHSLPHL